tara:strand:- start:608 stop:751 length:144 start_codon:yes stop_codon:yes gene_type:complete
MLSVFLGEACNFRVQWYGKISAFILLPLESFLSQWNDRKTFADVSGK